MNVVLNGATGTSALFQIANTATAGLNLTVSNTQNLSGSLTIAGGTGNVYNNLNFNGNDVINASGGIILGSNNSGGRYARLYYYSLTTGSINGDLTLNHGAEFSPQGATATEGVMNINGNVTLQTGGYTGSAPVFQVGRGGEENDFTRVKISGSLNASAGIINLYKGKTLEVGSATISTGGELRLLSYGTLESRNALFQSEGDLIIDGGRINNSIAAGTSGGYTLDVGGNFVLRTDSKVDLSSNALALTTLKLAGNLDIEATKLTSGNLNQLRLSLEGTDMQTLEAAVTNTTATFGIYSLTLNGSTVSLVDSLLNVGAGEYFKTEFLTNVGDSTLILNGLQFFAGGVELMPGVYDNYGGRLTVLAVVPEPSTFALLLGNAVVAFMLMRRQRKGA